MQKVIFCLLLLGLFSCKENTQKQENSSKKAKKVPSVYTLATSSGFVFRQDTLYFNNQKYSGYVYDIYASKDTAFVIGYLHGLQEGICKKWYEEKHQIAEDRYFVDGKKEGIHRAWFANGQVKFEFVISNDVYIGELKEWFSNRLLAKHFHYKNGQEEGSQKMWWDNGTIRANYVIKNGKKYGLLGVKLCKNVENDK